MEKICLSFGHGFGDCSLFALAIKSLVDRNYEVGIKCPADKEILFLAAGAKIVNHQDPQYRFIHNIPIKHHPYGHPSNFPSPNFHNAWISNKLGHSLANQPMPSGNPNELWNDIKKVKISLDNWIKEEDKDGVDSLIEWLPKPIIAIHACGNTSPHNKNLSEEEQKLLIHHLLDRFDGTIVSLDWDDRVHKVPHYRSRHMIDDLRKLSIPELAYFLNKCGLLISIDSGPMHFSHFTNVNCLGLWINHSPSHFAIPREKTLNIMSTRFEHEDQWRREEFNTICMPITGDNISNVAIKMLSEPKYFNKDNIARDVQMQYMVNKTRSHSAALSGYVDRNKSFDIALKNICNKENPIILETGTIRSEEDWGGAGNSTILFSHFLKHLGKGEFTSVDLNDKNVEFAKKWTSQYGEVVKIIKSHSHKFLRDYNGPKIDLFFSDSMDADMFGHDVNCLDEIKLVLPHLKENAQILIDDTVYNKKVWVGKGSLAVPYLLDHGWKLLYSGYQSLLTREGMPKIRKVFI